MAISQQEPFANCSALASRQDLAKYVKAIENVTSFDPTLLEACKSTICVSLWGDGNADISGIGMVTGYLFQSALGLLFAIIVLATSLKHTSRLASRLRYIAEETNRMYFQCAVFFAASVEISCVVVLARRDFAVSANGLGGLTVQITWTVALLCMLPLLYPMVILTFTDTQRANYRLFLFFGCLLLFFYTFLSRMIGTFGPSQIGEGKGEGGKTILDDKNWLKLNDLCLTGVQELTETERRVLAAFGVAASIVVILYGFCNLTWFILKYHSTNAASIMEKKLFQSDPSIESKRGIVMGTITLVLILTVPQIWAIFRLRGIQQQLAEASGNPYGDNQWTFGQVVAVMLFAPIFTEFGYLWGMTE